MTNPIVGPLGGWDVFCGSVGLAGLVLLVLAIVVAARTDDFDPTPLPLVVVGSILTGIGVGWWLVRLSFLAIRLVWPTG